MTTQTAQAALDPAIALDRVKQLAERSYAQALSAGSPRMARIFRHAAEQVIEHENPHFFYALGRLRRMPVEIDEFVLSHEFLGNLMEVWPTLMPDLQAMNPDVFSGERPVHEVLIGGATGCHAKGHPIRMWDGTVKAVEEVRVGNRLRGPDGLPRFVLRTVQGRETMLRVIPAQGSLPFEVNAGHILPLRHAERDEVMNVRLDRFLQLPLSIREHYRLQLVAPEDGLKSLTTFTIETLPEADYYGFALDRDHLYVDAAGVVHHNTGKTYLSQITQKYQLYLLTCMEMPQRLFRLTPATPIVMMMQSVSQSITKRVIYDPFRANFLAMPYAQRWVSYDKYRERELHIEGNILIVPALATLQSMVGQAIIGGILDEVNFMQIIEKSVQVAGPTGQGGRFDQAELVYTNMTRRRKRSFLTKGVSIGCICCVSSTRYKGDFLDRRIDEVRKLDEQNVLTLRRKQYEVVPQERFSGKTFPVLIGTDDYPTRVLEDFEEEGIHYPAGAQVEMVPVEYRADFRKDPEGAQRDIIGIASNAITPFIAQRDRIIDAMLAGDEFGLRSWVKKQDTNLQFEGMPQIVEEHLPTDQRARMANRFIHVDLSSSTDRCGIAVVRVLGRQAIAREDGLTEMLPVYAVEEALSIQPTPTHHIDPAEVRQWIMRLVSFYGLSVTCVSYDGYQSTESQILLRRAGIRTQQVSVDITSEPYTVFRRALYDQRIKMVRSEMLRYELSTLEYNAEKDKIDHPPRGSKDVSDAVAGAVYTASIHRGVSMGTGFTRPDGEAVMNAAATRRPMGSARPR